jgi:hypothetical protein
MNSTHDHNSWLNLLCSKLSTVIIPVWECDGEHSFIINSNTVKEAAKSGIWPICYEKRPNGLAYFKFFLAKQRN